MLNDALRWWAQQMRSLLPSTLARGSAADALLLREGVDGCAALLRRNRVVSPLAQMRTGQRLEPRVQQAARTLPVVLQMPHGALLVQDVPLPLAAEGELAAVLSHEMDRLTPFRTEDVFWSWRIAGRNRAAGVLDTQLCLLPKMTVQPALDTLAASSLRPAWLEAEGPDGMLHRIEMAGPGARRAVPGNKVAAMGWACAALAVMAAVLPFVQQARALAAAETRIGQARPGVAVAERLRAQLAQSAGGAGVIAEETARSGDALAALAAVTSALPDDTYLTALTLHARVLTLEGRSDAAVRLIGLLSGAPGLGDASFTAPVLRMVGDHGDQFAIRVTLAGRAAP